MMRFLFFSVCIWLTSTSQATEAVYSSKLLLRTGAGQLSNTGTQAGSAASVGSLNLQFLKYLNSKWSLIFGYMAEFDVSNGSTPINGMEIGSRYYIWNKGTQMQESSSWGHHSQRSLLATYTSFLYGKRQFYLGQDYQSNDATSTLKGEYAVLNAGIGLDYYLSRNYELNFEVSTSAISFASSDARVNLSETFLWFGVSYVF